MSCECGNTGTAAAPLITPLDLIRRSGIQDYLNAGSQVVTVASEPMVVDLIFPPNPDRHVLVESISFVGLLTSFTPQGAPISGLFLCPTNTEPETLAQAQAGVNLNARPIAIPLKDMSVGVVPVVGLGNFVTMIADLKDFLTVPAGYFIRAIISCNPATVNPGPGANSTGRLRANICYEKNPQKPAPAY